MKKQKKYFNVPFDFDWTYGVWIDQLKEDLEELEKLGANYIEIQTNTSYGEEHIEINAYSLRQETDQEFQERIDAVKKRETITRDLELQQLRKLKEKYGE